MANFKFLVLIVASAALAGVAQCSKEAVDYENPVGDQKDDLIQQLPGLNVPINFKQYSGYLNADDSPKPSRFLHYWFTESRNNPEKDPLLLWLNGGPGCSSLGGFFGELGPFSVNDDGKTLSIRNASWNTNANVIFLESPVGVGFSYSKKSFEALDDNSTAKQNHLALKSFLKKFPQYKDRDFYISGESYGGVYLPTLGVRLDNDPEINFKGIAIGNGYLDSKKLGQTLIFFSYYHGLFGKTLWERLSKDCCGGNPPAIGACDFQGPRCAQVITLATDAILESGINPYNYAADCQHPAAEHYLLKKSDSRVYSRSIVTRSLMKMSLNLTVDTNSPFQIFEPNGYSKARRNLREEPPCEDDTALISYLDNPEVQKAINIPSRLNEWAGPCATINYAMIYPDRKGGLAPQMQKLIDSPRKLKVLIYNGDLDMMCNFYGCEQFSDDLGREVVEDYQHWHVKNQVAGYFKTFKGFTFATVKGAGHMVPTDKPDESLAMIERWLLK